MKWLLPCFVVLTLLTAAQPAAAAPPTVTLKQPPAVAAGTSIQLQAESASDPDGQIVKFRWTVGDRAPVETQVSVYDSPADLAPGVYPVQLVAVDNSGEESQASTKNLVVQDQTKPVAILTAPATAPAGTPIALSGTSSTDQHGTITQYRWTVGTRAPVVTAEPTLDAPGLSPGRHTVTLMVTDSSGNESDPAMAQVTVVDQTAPVAVLDAPASVSLGATVPLSGTRSSDAHGRVVRYRWTVGTRPVVETADPTFNAPAGLPPGRHSATLVVTDDSGNDSAPTTTTFFVVDRTAPTALLDIPARTQAGESTTLSAARSTDVGGRVIRYRWTVGTAPVVETTDPTRVVAPLPLGRHPVTLVVTDDSGNDSPPVSGFITVVDSVAPVAVLDAPLTATADVAMALSGTRSTDVGGRVIRYRWTVGTRPVVETREPTFTAAGLPAGRHTVRLVVTDDSANDSAVASRTIDVRSAGTKVTTFGFATLIAPIGKRTSQITLDDATLLAGRIGAPRPIRFDATFTTGALGAGAGAAARVTLGRKSIRVAAGKLVRLKLRLSRRVLARLRGRRSVRVTMRGVATDRATGKKTARTRTITFEIRRR